MFITGENLVQLHFQLILLSATSELPNLKRIPCNVEKCRARANCSNSAYEDIQVKLS